MKDYAMYTDKGNQVVDSFIKAVKVAITPDSNGKILSIDALQTLFNKAYKDISTEYDEAGDTDVRESIFYALKEDWQTAGYSEESLDEAIGYFSPGY